MSHEQINDVATHQKLESSVEVNLVELLYYLKRKLGFIILSFIIGTVVAGAYTYWCITPTYKATSKIYMVSASTDSIVNLTDLNLGTSLSADYEQLIKTRPVIESVIKELNLNYSYQTLLNMLEVSTVDKTRIITITATSTIPEEAKNISNTLASKTVTYIPNVMETAEPNIAEQAITPTQKSSPSFKRNITLGAIICVAMCVGVLTLIFIKDDTVKTAEDIEKLFGVMPLTVIPEGSIDHQTGRRKNGKKKRTSKKKNRKKEVNNEEG